MNFCSADVVIPFISEFVHEKLSISLCKVSVCQRPCAKDLQVEVGADYTINQVIHLGLTVSSSNREEHSAFATEIENAFLSCSGSRNGDNKGRVFLLNR